MPDLSHLKEGDINFYASKGKISKDMAVFYNPIMKVNRDSTIALLNCQEKPPYSLLAMDIMAGSGIRALRLLKECPAIEKVIANDASSEAIEAIHKNAQLNGLEKSPRLEITHMDALRCLAHFPAADYIDVDPFGSPNRYLPLAIERTKNKGILAITATDTSALAGTYAATCMRKYWARPLRNELMHEVGLRILVRKVQLLGASLEVSFQPIYCFSTDHYVRLFFRAQRGKKRCDDFLELHKFLCYCANCGNRIVSSKNVVLCCEKEMQFAGPLWCGPLWDSALAQKMKVAFPYPMAQKIAEESQCDIVGFYDLHKMAKLLKCSIAKKAVLQLLLQKKGYLATVTHFTDTALRTNCPYEEFVSLFRKVAGSDVDKVDKASPGGHQAVHR